MGFFTQLRLLLWKNFIHRRRQPFRVIIEIVWPLCLFIILVSVRQRPDIKEDRSHCHYAPKAMPSAGTVPFLQSYVCDIRNDCNENASSSAGSNTINSFNSTLLETVIGDIENVLSNNLDVNLITNLGEDLRVIQELVDVATNITSSPESFLIPNSEVFDADEFRSQLAQQNIGLTPKAVDTLLSASFDPVKLFTDANETLREEFVEIIGELTRTQTLDANATDILLKAGCDDKLLLEYFEFKNETDAVELQSQVCALSPENATQLLQDLRDLFNLSAAEGEVRNMVERVTGQSLMLNASYLQKLAQVGRDFQQLDSIVSLFSNVQSSFSQLASDSVNGSLSVNSIGDIFCGSSKGFFNTSFDGDKESEDSKSDSKTQLNFAKNGTKYDRIYASYLKKNVSTECASFYASLESTKFTSFLWRQVKPIVLGVIPYTPDSPATRKIIKEASRTFESISSFFKLATDIEGIIPNIEKYLTNDIDPVRDFFEGNTCKETIRTLKALLPLVEFQLPLILPFESICESVSSFIARDDLNDTYTWRNALNNVESMLDSTTPYFKCFNLDKFVPFPSVDSLVDESLKLIGNNTFWAALVFKNVGDQTVDIPTLVKYDIRMDVDKVDDTARIMDKYWRPGPRGRWYIDLKYFTYGFIYIQDMVDHAIIRLHTNQTQEPGVYTQQFPYPCWVRDKFVFAISRSLPLFMVISWIYSVAMIIKGIVYEKEMRLKEVMKIMGLGNGVHWLAWFINSFVVMLITIILFVIILKVGKILEYSDPGVVFVFLLAFTLSTIALCFLVSTLFSKANLAAVCGGFIYFVIYLPYTQLVQWDDEITTMEKFIACLSANIAMGYSCSYFAVYEEQAIGAKWSNIGTSPIIDDDFTLAASIWMMFLDTAIYLLLTWYIEAVFPGQYGMPHKWYFPVQKSYWLGKTPKTDDSSVFDAEMPIDNIRDHNPNFEEDPKDRTAGVAIRNLYKVYNKGDKVAVDGLTINFYEGQITSFLGHNGAGKTTTMSILTGLFPPTSGTAFVYGKDIKTSVDEIRKDLGMCPQHNVLFDLLTVEEHIWFYARLKGRTNAEVKMELDQMIMDIGLPHKRKEQSKNLSGGMKRKLSVAIAFVGGSKTVILDEPTAGVDPYARRAIWELLLKFRKGRTIVLSTHHMDEADVLGDRIAIISQGKLCTVGTSLFLKNRFGSGYYLTLVRQDQEQGKGVEGDECSSVFGASDSISTRSRPSTAGSIRTLVDVKASMVDNEDEGYDEKRSDSDSPTPLAKKSAKIIPGFNLPRLTIFIQQYIPQAELVEDNSIEVCFRLPETEGHAASFSKLFEQLELVHHELGISSYGISDTNLEEVFLKVAEDNWVEDGQEERRRTRLEETSENGRYPRPVSKLSFRKKDKTSLFSFNMSNRVNASMERLTEAANDSDSIASDNDTETTETDFRGAGKLEQVAGKKLVGRQLTALFLKRFHHVRRSKKGFISEIILPAGFVCLAMIFSLIMPPFSEMPRLELQPWMYEPSRGSSSLKTFYSNDNPTNTLAQALEQNVNDMPYFGTRCMNSSFHKIGGKPCLSPKVTSHWTANPLLQNVPMTSPACSCSSGFQRCPAKAGGPKPPMQKIRTNDKFYNMSGRDVSDWLMKTMDKYQKRRYGGFSFVEDNPLGRLSASQLSNVTDRLVKAANNDQSIFSGSEQIWKDLDAALKYAFVQENGKVWFNNKGWTSSVSYMNAFNNLLLRTSLPAGVDPSHYGIVTANYPMNFTKEQLNEETLYKGAVDVVVAICVIFAMSFVPASFVIFLIEERVSNSKHLQFVSGINPTTYWIANSAWDMINYSIPAILCILIFLAFGKDSYVSSNNFPCLFALLFLYGWSIIPMMYPFSRIFSVPSSAFVALSCVNVFIGTVSTLATFILEILATEDKDLADINDILKQVFLVFPHYCLGRGLMDMASYQLQSDVNKRLGLYMEYSPFDWKIVGRNIFAMAMLGFFFTILNLLIEYKFFLSWLFISRNSVSKIKSKDIDVAREEERVQSGRASEDVLRLEGLTKVYWTPGGKGKLTAVDHLSVGVHKGQCFGLLGVNGAGKTTTFKMLTGDVGVSSGDAYVNQYSVQKDMVQVRRFMGYCPQFDALDPLLSGREHLEFYARVRGIAPSQVKSVADWAIRRLGLTPYADKIASSYSGGNKRKLSTAIAIIGNPPIIFLDEPTTGMDPRARRFLWNCINNIVKSGRSVILTSHSMEECEALCSRLAIMVNGTFQCLGSIQHLKTRFGNGYTIILRVSGQNPNMTPVMQFIASSFPSAKLREKHHNMLQYQLGTDNLSLSQLFNAMEEAKMKFGVEDYSVSQTTLDQVFINFAKKQTDMLDDELDEDENAEDAFNDDIDNLSRIYDADSVSTAPSEYDGESVTGSTFELVRSDSRNGQMRFSGRGQSNPEMANVSIA